MWWWVAEQYDRSLVSHAIKMLRDCWFKSGIISTIGKRNTMFVTTEPTDLNNESGEYRRKN